MDSQLVYAVKRDRNEPVAVEWLRVDVELDVDNRAFVDIEAAVTNAVLEQIERTGGTVMSSYPKYNAVRAWVPLAAIEALAGLPDVRFVGRAARAATNANCCGGTVVITAGNALSATGEEVTGSVTSEGDITHRATDSLDFLAPPGVYNIEATPNGVAAGPEPDFTEISVISFQDPVNTPVPEPATATLLMISGLIFSARVRSWRA